MIPASRPQVASVLHAVVVVKDVERSLGFYRDLLGLAVKDDNTHDPEILGRLTGYECPDARWLILEADDGSEVELVEFRSPSVRPSVEMEWRDAGIRSITFVVNDIRRVVDDMMKEHVQFFGGIIEQPSAAGGTAKVVYCRDPDGVIVTLAELPMPPGRQGHRE